MAILYDLPIDIAVEMAERIVLSILSQYVNEEDQHEARRRLAAKLQLNRPVRTRLDWRKKST